MLLKILHTYYYELLCRPSDSLSVIRGLSANPGLATRWPGPTKCGPRHPFEIVNALTLIKSEINNYRPTQYWWAEGLKQLEFQLELVSKVCSVIPTLSYEYYVFRII